MIECNGSHVITHKYKHGNSVYRCTLANAQKLLADCLTNYAQSLARLSTQLEAETRPIRAFDWLLGALRDVHELKESTTRLRRLLYGAGPKQREEPDLRPVPVITKAMQDELVLLFFHNKFDIGVLTGKSGATEALLTTCWNELSFLQPAHERLSITEPNGLRFVEDYEMTGYEDLQALLKTKWKQDAREERIVGAFVRFLNAWNDGHWDVEIVKDL